MRMTLTKTRDDSILFRLYPTKQTRHRNLGTQAIRWEKLLLKILLTLSKPEIRILRRESKVTIISNRAKTKNLDKATLHFLKSALKF